MESYHKTVPITPTVMGKCTRCYHLQLIKHLPPVFAESSVQSIEYPDAVDNIFLFGGGAAHVVLSPFLFHDIYFDKLLSNFFIYTIQKYIYIIKSIF